MKKIISRIAGFVTPSRFTYAMTFCGIFVVFLVSGCGLTPQGDALRAAVQVKGADVYDEGLANAVWFKCRAASVGAIERRYMQNDETWELWTKECLGSGTIELPEDRPPAE